MIAISDNTAANEIAGVIHPQSVNDTMARLGLSGTHFVNLFNDDPVDTGVAGVDIYKMDADGKAIEHWDTLQLVGGPKNSAPWVAPDIPAANSNGMF